MLSNIFCGTTKCKYDNVILTNWKVPDSTNLLLIILLS